MLHFRHHVFGQVVDGSVARVGRIAERQGDDLFVHFPAVLHRDHADRKAADERAVQNRFGTHHEDVERVPVLRERARNKSVVRGIVGRRVEHAVQDQHPGLFVEFVFLFLPLGDLDIRDKVAGRDAFGGNVVPDIHRFLLYEKSLLGRRLATAPEILVYLSCSVFCARAFSSFSESAASSIKSRLPRRTKR